MAAVIVASIGKIASPSQGVAYLEQDGYYAKDNAVHLDASGWAGRGAEWLGLSGPVDSERFRNWAFWHEVPDGYLPVFGRTARMSGHRT